MIHKSAFAIILAALCLSAAAQQREHTCFDHDWLFSLGHATDFNRDFGFGTGYFSYMTKTGYGDGPAAANFDDRAWRRIDVPHDWCVELPFSENGGHSHGYRAIGLNFPENSVGWYRKHFNIPQSDLGQKIFITFDGIHRNSKVFVNGFYLGCEHSGYLSTSYDITDYLNYGGENVVSVRADASLEEGWYYEGAGIYRHVWLTKTNRLHIDTDGVFASSQKNDNQNVLTVRTTVVNQDKKIRNFAIINTISDADGKKVSETETKILSLNELQCKTFYQCLSFPVDSTKLWSPENPYLYNLQTNIVDADNMLIDSKETIIGIRYIEFDAKQGFLLNGKPYKILGTNMHQDHAGVGSAIPDELQSYRIGILKDMGSNAIRCSHNPATPEMLDACDRLGMLVLDENRLQGINHEHFGALERMIHRDRNHPCIVAWSLGNEEWAIESNIKGERITSTMQQYARTLDSTRMFTVAVSGGCGYGSSESVELMGFNYLAQCNIDEYHKTHPNQPKWGTEETSGCGTRGIYTDDRENGFAAQFDRNGGVSIERGWNFYNERPWLAGLFFWTGFDYRGEPNPLKWPAVGSQFGIVDQCGFPKDSYFYLKAWWGEKPVLHLFPHWNWQGNEGQIIDIWAYSNCDEVELMLNKKSQGKKTMPKNGHISWQVPYEHGTLVAYGYKNGEKIISHTISTTGKPFAIKATPHKKTIKADGEDCVVIDIQIVDKNGLVVPTANNLLNFEINGEAKFAGVGNGNPASHENDVFVQNIKELKINNMKELSVDNLENRSEVNPKIDASTWRSAFERKSDNWKDYTDSLLVIRGTFELPDFDNNTLITLFGKSILENQSIYINGQLIAEKIERDANNQIWIINNSCLHKGTNTYAAVGKRFKLKHMYDEPNTNPGTVQIMFPEPKWSRCAFNGLAQVIVKAGSKKGGAIVKISSDGLQETQVVLKDE